MTSRLTVTCDGCRMDIPRPPFTVQEYSTVLYSVPDKHFCSLRCIGYWVDREEKKPKPEPPRFDKGKIGDPAI